MVATTPNADAPYQDWHDWGNRLEALWLEAIGLSREELTFTQEEANALADYLYATELLLRCKEAAIRIPKQAWADLEARLLTWQN